MRGEYKIIIGSALFALIPVATIIGSSTGNIALLAGRLSIAAFILFLMDAEKKTLFTIPRQQWFHLLLFALLMLAAMLLYFYAIPLIGMAKASALLGIQPALLLILGGFFLKERITVYSTIICLTCLTGILLVTDSNGTTPQNSTTGNIFALASALCLSLIFVIQKKHLKSFSGNRLVFYQCLLQLPFLLPIMFVQEVTIDLNGVYAILLLGVICTAIAYALIYTGSRTVHIATVGILQSVEYILPAFIGVLFFNEVIHISAALGIVCIVVSCLLTVKFQQN